MNKKLKDALKAAGDGGATVEHEGMTIRLVPPTGREAVKFVADARRLSPSKRLRTLQEAQKEAEDKSDFVAGLDAADRDAWLVHEQAMMDFVAKWFHVLVRDAKADAKRAWHIFQVLGGFEGPVPEAMMTMVERCLGIAPKQLEDVPFSPPDTEA